MTDHELVNTTPLADRFGSAALGGSGATAYGSSTTSGAFANTTPPSDSPSDESNTQRNVYVSNLPQAVTDYDLRTLFATIGPVKSHKLMVDIKSGVSRGFGFVLFSKPSDAAAAVRTLNGRNVWGTELHVKLADQGTRTPGENSNWVFIRNLPSDIGESGVVELCRCNGAVLQVLLRRDERHGQKGAHGRVSTKAAHVEMESIGTAVALAARLNNSHCFAGVPVPLQAKVVDRQKQARVVPHPAQRSSARVPKESDHQHGTDRAAGSRPPPPLLQMPVPTGIPPHHHGVLPTGGHPAAFGGVSAGAGAPYGLGYHGQPIHGQIIFQSYPHQVQAHLQMHLTPPPNLPQQQQPGQQSHQLHPQYMQQQLHQQQWPTATGHQLAFPTMPYPTQPTHPEQQQPVGPMSIPSTVAMYSYVPSPSMQ